MKLYVVRHGETEFNVQRLMQGRMDSPLTERGREMALSLGKGLADVDFVHAFSSSLKRASDTAELILSNRNVELTLVDDLQEVSFGDLEGKPVDMLEWNVETIRNGFASFHGEGPDEAGERIVKVYGTIAEQYPEGNVLVVSHGGVILYGMEKLIPGFNEDYPHGIANCSVTVLDVSGGIITAETVGDESYLRKGRNK